MKWENLVGKYLLIGITFLDENEEVIEQFQTHGPVISADDLDGIVIEKPGGSGAFCVPPDRRSLSPARKGQYRLRATGEIVDDPDYVSTWTVEKAVPENIEEYKRSGFRAFLHKA
jgi:hypothetical protein